MTAPSDTPRRGRGRPRQTHCKRGHLITAADREIGFCLTCRRLDRLLISAEMHATKLKRIQAEICQLQAPQ